MKPKSKPQNLEEQLQRNLADTSCKCLMPNDQRDSCNHLKTCNVQDCLLRRTRCSYGSSRGPESSHPHETKGFGDVEALINRVGFWGDCGPKSEASTTKDALCIIQSSSSFL